MIVLDLKEIFKCGNESDFLYLNLLFEKPNILRAIVSFSDKSGSCFFIHSLLLKKALKPFKAFGKTAIEKVEQNELVKQATVTVTDVAKKGAQYVENAPLIKDFNEEQKKFIRFENLSNIASSACLQKKTGTRQVFSSKI